MDNLGKEELRAVLAAALAGDKLHWLMYLVPYHHGLRATEVVGGWLAPTRDRQRLVRGNIVVIPGKPKRWYPGLTPQSVSGGYLTVARLKGSDKTTQELIVDPDPLFSEREALETLARSLPGTNRIFPFSRVHYFRLFRKYAKRAGLPAHKWHPHTLKHTIAMDSIEDAGIHNVQKHLGHKSLASTGVYLEVSDQQAGAAIARARERRRNAS